MELFHSVDNLLYSCILLHKFGFSPAFLLTAICISDLNKIVMFFDETTDAPAEGATEEVAAPAEEATEESSE